LDRAQTVPTINPELRAIEAKGRAATTQQTSLAPSIGLVGMDQIEEKRIAWLWNGYRFRYLLSSTSGLQFVEIESLRNRAPRT
jgi:hypothetical protein